MVDSEKRILRLIDKHALHWHLYNNTEPNYRDVLELLHSLRLEIDMDNTPSEIDYIAWLLDKGDETDE